MNRTENVEAEVRRVIALPHYEQAEAIAEMIAALWEVIEALPYDRRQLVMMLLAPNAKPIEH